MTHDLSFHLCCFSLLTDLVIRYMPLIQYLSRPKARDKYTLKKFNFEVAESQASQASYWLNFILASCDLHYKRKNLNSSVLGLLCITKGLFLYKPYEIQ